jgi:hypothetical protein
MTIVITSRSREDLGGHTRSSEVHSTQSLDALIVIFPFARVFAGSSKLRDAHHASGLVPVDGFEWIEAYRACLEDGQDPGPDQWRVDRDVLTFRSRQPKLVRRNVLNEPTLFRTFADVELTKDGIRQFANQYGWLGFPSPYIPRAASRSPSRMTAEEVDDSIVWGERIFDWLCAIDTMRNAVGLWDLIRKNDVRELGKRIVLTQPQPGDLLEEARWSCEATYEKPPPGTSVRDRMRWRQRLNAGMLFARRQRLNAGTLLASDVHEHDGVVFAAQRYLQTWVNRQLGGEVSPQIAFDAATGDPTLEYQVHTLESTLWLQLAQAMCGHKQQRTCPECGTWFEISRDRHGKTERRVYCSTACRCKSYRRRRDEATEQAGTTSKPSKR